eukprot:1351960-Pyramimonas_sp.AAC.1
MFLAEVSSRSQWYCMRSASQRLHDCSIACCVIALLCDFLCTSSSQPGRHARIGWTVVLAGGASLENTTGH